MSELDLSSRRRRALDLLLQGRITHEQYELLLCEIEQTHPVEFGTLTGHATRSTPTGPKSGEVLEGRFELLEPIGRGAMGVVWKARDRGGDRIVCLKFLPPEIQHDAAELARVKEIFGKVHALQHEHLCPFYLLGDDPRYKTFVVMKFVPGRTLGDYRHDYVQEHGAFPLDEAIWIADRLAQALDYVHRKNLVHRDVKPANILVDRAENDVQLVDLGLTAEVRSSLVRVSKQVGELAGTAPYMAPEQWRGQFIDGSADQYALAVTVYELLAGRLPFDCPNDAAWMHCAMNEAIPPIEAQPAWVNAALFQALSKDRKQRFRTCAEFVKSLFVGMAPSIVDSPAPTAVPPPASAPFDAARAKAHQADWAKYFGVPVEMTNSIGARLIIIPPGEFLMGHKKRANKPEDVLRFSGHPYGDIALDALAGGNESPPHRVRITRPYYLCTTTVTRGQFARFVQAENYKTEAERTGEGGHGYDEATDEFASKPEFTWRFTGFPEDDDHPVVNVSWNDATAYCKWLSRKESKQYRLPTEAEWEYACRAGTTTDFHFIDDESHLGEYAWYEENADGKTPSVGMKRANAFGLCDMHGSVWEWCNDWEDAYGPSPASDPTGPVKGRHRVRRGGCWYSPPRECRSASRFGIIPDWCDVNQGFRVALVPNMK